MLIEKLRRNSFYHFLSLLCSAGSNLLLLLVLSNKLGMSDYGIFVASQARVVFWLFLADLGLFNGLIAEFSHASLAQKEKLALLLRVGCLRLAVVACLFAGLSLLYGDSEPFWWRNYFPYLIGYALYQTVAAFTMHAGWQKSTAWASLVGNSMGALLTIMLALYGGSASGLLLMHSTSSFLSFILVCSVLLVRVDKAMWKEARRAFRSVKIKGALSKESFLYAGIMACSFQQSRLDQLVAGTLLSPAQVGVYGATIRLMSVPLLLSSVVLFAAFPYFQELGAKEPQKIARTTTFFLKLSFRYLLLPMFAVNFALTFAFFYFGKRGIEFRWISFWLFPGFFCLFLLGPVQGSLFSIRRVDLAFWGQIWGGLAFLCLVLTFHIFLPWKGLEPIMIAFDVGALVSLGVSIYALRLCGMLRPGDRKIWRAFDADESRMLSAMLGKLNFNRSEKNI